MRYFLDTEFHENGKTIDLISLALVAEDGRELYIENADFSWRSCSSEWLHQNVRPHLWSLPQDKRKANEWIRDGGYGGLVPYRHIGRDVHLFCDPAQHGKPEFWGYYADYDWVVFCWLFGKMIDLPEGFPMFCRDIKQLACDLGNPRLPEQSSTEHHALADARWNKEAYEYLQNLKSVTNSAREDEVE